MAPHRVPDIADRVASIVLAGGQGTRLFPLTQTRCKPAVSFGGKYRLIDIPLSNSLNSQIRRIFVISQYLAATLNQHIQATYHLDPFQHGSIDLVFPQETKGKKVFFEGTADAIRKNLELFLATPVDYFLILSGDQLYNIDFTDMLTQAMATDADLTIATMAIEEHQAGRLGVLSVDDHGQIIDFFEKPQEKELLQRFALSPAKRKTLGAEASHLGSMGIYIFKRQALIELLREEGNDFGKHLIPIQVRRGGASAYLYHGYWEDIGTIDSFYQANLALLGGARLALNTYDEENPIYTCPYHLPNPRIGSTRIERALIAPGAVVEAEELKRSIVGIRARIGHGSRIHDSILLGAHFYNSPPYRNHTSHHLVVGEECQIERAILDEGCRLGNGVRLTNEKKLITYDGQGIYIRDGIIVVAAGTELPDGFVL